MKYWEKATKQTNKKKENKREEKQRKTTKALFPARIELATFRVLGGRDNHYTTETAVYDKSRVRGIIGISSLGRTRKFIPLLWNKGGGGVDGTPPRFFWYVAVFWIDLDNKMGYILGVVVLLEACDVTNNGRHFGFYQE